MILLIINQYEESMLVKAPHSANDITPNQSDCADILTIDPSNTEGKLALD